MPVPDFAPGEILTAAAMDSIGLWKVTTSSFTGATSASPVNVTSCFSADYLNYLIMLNTISGTTANVQISAQLLNGTTPATGADYRQAESGSTQAGATSNAGSLVQTSFTVTYTAKDGTVGTEFTLHQPQTTVRTTLFGNFFYDDGTVLIHRRTGGQHNLANSYDGIRIFPLTGSINGSVTVYGYRK